MHTANHSIAKGMLAGAIGGLAGSLAMNQFQAVAQKASKAWEGCQAHKQPYDSTQAKDQSSEEDDATMKTADRISMLIRHHHLSQEQRKKAGPVVHYAYGAFLGAVYGALSEVTPRVRKGAGTVYGATVWVAGDEIAVPRMGLAGPPSQYPIRVHANALASHLVYATTTEWVRRGLRAIL